MSPPKMDVEQFVHNLQQNFHTDLNLDDITFKSVNIEPYNPPEFEANNKFGEKQTAVYYSKFTVFNIDFTLRFLCFIYTKHAEVLKLEIHIHNTHLEQEITSCRNFLQRKRNVNLAFDTLAKAAKLFESRRLICETVIAKQQGVTITSRDSGIFIKCCQKRNPAVIYLEVDWTISWNLEECELSDFLEFFCNYLVLEASRSKRIKSQLHLLVQGDIGFHLKLKVWKNLLRDLYAFDEESTTKTDVLEISDSDSDIIVIKSCDNSYNRLTDEVLVID